MAQHFLNSNNINGSRLPASMAIPSSTHITQDNYDYELQQLMERERQLMTAQKQLPIDNNVIASQNTSYVPSSENLYRYVRQNQNTPPIDQRVLQPTSTNISAPLSSTKPLRIIIIRHA
jgi:hypothetical protein